jgi:hypothetical protein
VAGTEKTLIAASIVAGFLLSASVAGATTIAVLQTSTFAADDRAVMELNGDVVSSTGIYGPGVGNFYFTDSGPNNPFTFQYGNSGPFAPITTGFVSGVNTLLFIVNNTGNGIHGGASDGPSGVYFDGTVTFSAAPEPTTWSMMLVGVGGLGAMMRTQRRKRKLVTL